MLIGTIQSGATTEIINLQYVPQSISWADPVAGGIQGIKVEVLGTGVLVDLDVTGLTSVCQFLQKGTGYHVLNLADGLIKNKTCVITLIGNTAANDIDVYATSEQSGSLYVRHNKFTILPNNNVSLAGFAVCFMPSLATGDKVTATYKDGTTQIWEDIDLASQTMYYQCTADNIVNNINNNVKDIQILVATQQLVYITDYLKA